MKLLLIQPAQMFRDGRLIRFTQTISYPIGLVTLAGLTPPDIDVTIKNESVDEIDLDAEVDVVGITGYSSQITRGYQLADAFRQRGIPVIMGGIHVSLNPDEAEQHADAILIGEAEGIWPHILADVRANRLKKRYKLARYPDMSSPALPRYDLVARAKYIQPPLGEIEFDSNPDCQRVSASLRFLFGGTVSWPQISYEADSACPEGNRSLRLGLSILFGR